MKPKVKKHSFLKFCFSITYLIFMSQYSKKMLLSSLLWSSYNDAIMVSAETKTLIHSMNPLLEIVISDGVLKQTISA